MTIQAKPQAAVGLRVLKGLRRRIMLALMLVVAAGFPLGALADDDPWEGANRKVYGFNDTLDRWLLKPVAKGYDWLFPKPIKRGIRNVFTNIGTPIVAVNQLLQGKPGLAVSDTTRFVLNSTLGLAGIFDVATPNGLPAHDEDFGQTFVRWGVPDGRFLMLPLVGPSTPTAAVGSVLDGLTNPVRLVSPKRDRYIIRGIRLIDRRANLLSTESLITGDPYIFIRDAYLQRRDFLINDGVVEDDPFLDEYDEDFE